MGAGLAKHIEPEDLAVFKKLPPHSKIDHIEIPEKAENRLPTDKKYLIIFCISVFMLFPFMIYTLANSNIHRYFGYDSCGNVCGQMNDKYDQLQCTGLDLTNKGLLEIEDLNGTLDIFSAPRTCVSQCSEGYIEVSNYCLKRDYRDSSSSVVTWSMVTDYLNSVAWRISLASLLSVVIGMVMLILFRRATAVMVWLILIAVLVTLTIAVGALWYAYTTVDKEDSQGLLIVSIFLTVFLIVILILMVFLRRKIALLIILLKESMKATFAMPRLLFAPVFVLFGALIIAVPFVVTTVYMVSAGVLTDVGGGYKEYRYNFPMYVALVYNVWITIWSLQFVSGIYYMSIAGAVAKWYFARNKNALDNPVKTSIYVTFKYHLGTIAFGSLIITIVAIIRSLIQSLTKNRGMFCCQSIERFIKFLSKNAYIITAMHGRPFYKSGKRAAQIILQNVVNVASINYIGNFILGMAQVLIILLSMVITYLLLLGTDQDYAWYSYLIVLIVAILVAAVTFSIFGTVIDTIFMCFCEDSLLNDGMTKPYAMSRELMEFIEESKKVFVKKSN